MYFPTELSNLVVYGGEASRVENAHKAETCSQAVRSVPYGRRSQHLGCEQSDIERVCEGSQEGCSCREKPGWISMRSFGHAPGWLPRRVLLVSVGL